MAASIALGCGVKALVCGSRPWRGRQQAKLVTRLHFCHQQFLSERRKPVYGTLETRRSALTMPDSRVDGK